MTKITKLCSAPNGIVFLYDPTMIVDVPPDTGHGPILYTENCISIWTIHEYEGNVELTISDEEKEYEDEMRFSGNIIVENGRVAFNSSEVRELIGMNIDKGSVNIKIYSDDKLSPERVLCLIGTS